MNSLKHILLIIIAIVFAFGNSSISAQKKRALLVGINDYGNPRRNAGRWRNIHGADDVRLLYPILAKQNFSIDTLLDKSATHSAIIKRLESLIGKAQKGDIAYLHFSMHGQVFDDRLSKIKDEADGWDEALIPYDAKMKYSTSYKGENHLLDDELHTYVERLRRKVGGAGHVYVVIDACHAGEQSKGDEYERGTIFPFTNSDKQFRPDRTKRKKYFKLSTSAGKSPVTYLEACQSYEKNIEVKDNKTRRRHGPLSLHIARVISRIPISANPSWTATVEREMRKDGSVSCNQTMVIEKSY